MKINRGKVPPGGWHFRVAPGVILHAINEEELVRQIFEYRLRNNIPTGDIERDIDAYYCAQWPTACHREPSDHIPEEAPRAPLSEALIKRVTRWAAELVHRQPKGGYSLVSAEEAVRRGNICVGCPKNQPWRVGCRGCSNNTATVLTSLRKLQNSKRSTELVGCEVAGWDNETAVWMPADALSVSGVQAEQLPERCWKRSL